MDWPEGLDLSNYTKFEAEARTRRYQALGKTCRDKGIGSLIVGQHKDDQAETVLMRLTRGRHRSGLPAMKHIGWMPECFGVHGVYHSGSPPSDTSSVASLFEHGGMRVLRPLLDIEKNRLIATCKMHGTRWAEDATNQDRTLTNRNAIRHILRNHRLPEVLSTENVVAVGQRMRSRLDNHRAAAAALYSSCSFKFDFQTGSLVVQFPPAEAFFPDPNHVPSPSEKLHARATAHYFVEAIVSLVSPREHLVLESIANFVTWFWPTLAPDHLPARTDIHSHNNDCVFLPVDHKQQPNDPATRHLSPWLIARQPPNKGYFDNTPPAFPPKHNSDWRFFDGRYWVRVQNLTDRPITMRFLSDAQLEKILQADFNTKAKGHLKRRDPNALPFDRKNSMRIALKAIEQQRLRRYLPALFLEPAKPDEEPTLLALPTLQASPDPNDDSDRWECRWEIRYKKIDPGLGRSLADVVNEPVFHPLERRVPKLELEQEAIQGQIHALFAEGKQSQRKQKFNQGLADKKQKDSMGSKAEQPEQPKQPERPEQGMVLTKDMREMLHMSSTGRSIAWAEDVGLVRKHDDSGRHKMMWKGIRPVTWKKVKLSKGELVLSFNTPPSEK